MSNNGIIFNSYGADSILDEKGDRPLSDVHIRLQQRSGKKCITIIEGLAEDLDLKLISKALRRTLKTASNVLKNKDNIEFIKLNGDCRKQVRDFLIKYKVVEYPTDNIIKIHGF